LLAQDIVAVGVNRISTERWLDLVATVEDWAAQQEASHKRNGAVHTDESVG
jgi:hypothetical protein